MKKKYLMKVLSIPTAIFLTTIAGYGNQPSTSYASSVTPLTKETAEKISEGQILTKSGHWDPLLNGKPALDPDKDDDGDGILNKDEIAIGEEDGKQYIEYVKGNPRLKDSDGDGISDGEDE